MRKVGGGNVRGATNMKSVAGLFFVLTCLLLVQARLLGVLRRQRQTAERSTDSDDVGRRQGRAAVTTDDPSYGNRSNTIDGDVDVEVLGTENAENNYDRRRPRQREPLHVLFALSGNHTGFLQEFEVALKSLLLNAPIDQDDSSEQDGSGGGMIIHVMADGKAFGSLEIVFLVQTQLNTWRTRTPITIRTYNVQSHVARWRRRIIQLYRDTGLSDMVLEIGAYHTIGTWFRLFADDVLPQSVASVLYLDTDAVILANLQQFVRQVGGPGMVGSAQIDNTSDPVLFYIGKQECAGFVVINVKELKTTWEAASKIDLQRASERLNQDANDQLVLKAILDRFPSMVGRLPNEWDMNVANAFPVIRLNNVVQKRPELGVMHFNGGSNSKKAYFLEHRFLLDHSADHTWGLAKYYVQMPWHWARFVALSRIRTGHAGYAVKVEHNPDEEATQDGVPGEAGAIPLLSLIGGPSIGQAPHLRRVSSTVRAKVNIRGNQMHASSEEGVNR